VRGVKPFHDQRCFLWQQSSEKYLKVLLEEVGQSIPRTHISRDLLALLQPQYRSLRSLARGLKFLTRFAVGVRYPGEKASKRQAASALRWAGKIRATCRTLLGIRSSHPRRHRPG